MPDDHAFRRRGLGLNAARKEAGGARGDNRVARRIPLRSRASTPVFTSSFSGTFSCTKSAPLTASSMEDDEVETIPARTVGKPRFLHDRPGPFDRFAQVRFRARRGVGDTDVQPVGETAYRPPGADHAPADQTYPLDVFTSSQLHTCLLELDCSLAAETTRCRTCVSHLSPAACAGTLGWKFPCRLGSGGFCPPLSRGLKACAGMTGVGALRARTFLKFLARQRGQVHWPWQALTGCASRRLFHNAQVEECHPDTWHVAEDSSFSQCPGRNRASWSPVRV